MSAYFRDGIEMIEVAAGSFVNRVSAERLGLVQRRVPASVAARADGAADAPVKAMRQSEVSPALRKAIGALLKLKASSKVIAKQLGVDVEVVKAVRYAA